MTYWGAGVGQNDCESSAAGVTVLLIYNRIIEETNICIEEQTAEAPTMALFRCLRAIGREFPHEAAVHIRKKQLDTIKSLYLKWYEASSNKIPKKYREQVKEEALKEIQLYYKEVKGDNPNR